MTRLQARSIWAAALSCPALCWPALGAEVAPWTAFEPTVMVVPPEVPNPMLDRSCWIRLSDGPAFSGQSFVLVGPAEMRALDVAAISRFRRRVASAETGPKAAAKLYSEEGFGGTSLSMAPSSRQPDITHKLGGSGRHVAALRLACTD